MLENRKKKRKMSLICKALCIYFFFTGKLLFMLGLSCHVLVLMSLGTVSEVPKEGAQQCLMTAVF